MTASRAKGNECRLSTLVCSGVFDIEEHHEERNQIGLFKKSTGVQNMNSPHFPALRLSDDGKDVIPFSLRIQESHNGTNTEEPKGDI
jgi:hypothetical protein